MQMISLLHCLSFSNLLNFKDNYFPVFHADRFNDLLKFNTSFNELIKIKYILNIS